MTMLQVNTDAQKDAVTQADIEQARARNLLYAEDHTVLTLLSQERDCGWRSLHCKRPVWVVVRRDAKLLPEPYPAYNKYHRQLTGEHWARAVKPNGHQRANAFYRRAMTVTWTLEGRFIGIPREAPPAGVSRAIRRIVVWVEGKKR